jgi:hypothetical protein
MRRKSKSVERYCHPIQQGLTDGGILSSPPALEHAQLVNSLRCGAGQAVMVGNAAGEDWGKWGSA